LCYSLLYTQKAGRRFNNPACSSVDQGHFGSPMDFYTLTEVVVAVVVAAIIVWIIRRPRI
jgi:hypothetical protein